MEYLVKLYDELDDLFGPLFVMAGVADLLCGGALIASVVAALVLGSAKVAVVGAIAAGLIVAAREWMPAPTAAPLTPARQLR